MLGGHCLGGSVGYCVEGCVMFVGGSRVGCLRLYRR